MRILGKARGSRRRLTSASGHYEGSLDIELKLVRADQNRKPWKECRRRQNKFPILKRKREASRKLKWMLQLQLELELLGAVS